MKSSPPLPLSEPPLLSHPSSISSLTWPFKKPRLPRDIRKKSQNSLSKSCSFKCTLMRSKPGKIREEREKPSMMDAFTAMSLERRENEQNEESLLDAFTAMTLKRRESRGEEKSFMDLITNIAREEREQPSMMDAFTAMTLERRVAETEEKKPSFLDFMIGMAQAEAKPKSFMDATTKMIIKQREQPSMMEAFSAMTLEKRLAEAELVKLSEKGLPHAMAMMAVKEYEAKQVVDTKELTFLNDVLHPEHVYEPFSFTAVKAAHKYFTN